MAEPTQSRAGLTVIRASSLNQYADCARRTAADVFRFDIQRMGYDLREKSNGIGAAIGTAVHYSSTTMLLEKAKTGLLAPKDMCEDVAILTLRATVKLGIQYDKTTSNLNDGEIQARAMQKVFRDTVAPDVHPVLVETRLEAEVVPGLVVSGQADYLAREPHSVEDLKTGVQEGSYKPQVGSYSMLARSHDHTVEKAKVTFIKRPTVKKLQTEGAPPAKMIEYNLEQIESAAWSIIGMMYRDITTFRNGDEQRKMQPGDPWAFSANPNSKLCGEKYCSAYGNKGAHSFCTEWKENTKED